MKLDVLFTKITGIEEIGTSGRHRHSDPLPFESVSGKVVAEKRFFNINGGEMKEIIVETGSREESSEPSLQHFVFKVSSLRKYRQKKLADTEITITKFVLRWTSCGRNYYVNSNGTKTVLIPKSKKIGFSKRR